MNQNDAIQLVNDLIHTGNENYEINEIVAALELADNLYYNKDESYCSDAEYDALRNYGRRIAPHHVYFTGVGSDVRGGKIKLPYQMGSLDQVEIGDITDWVGSWSLQNQEMIITDKLDGTSAMVIYDDAGDLQIAYSRGNGIEGADITRHIKHIVPANIGSPAVIRGEVIIPKTAFDKARKIASARSGREYKNARNMGAGLMNSKSNDARIYSHIDFVAYEIIGYGGIDKVHMLRELEDYGFKTPFWTSHEGKELTDRMLADYLTDRRSKSDYEIDGVVIDVNLASKRDQMNPTRDTLNPAYAIKYKVADASNYAEAEVVGIEWGVSKHGYLKPRINIKPIELVGVTVQYCTGFNAKFIHDNKIGPGAVIAITRSGDVIPYVTKVVRPADHWQQPKHDWEWNETGVDAILKNHHESDDVAVNQLVDFFASIEAPMLRKGNIKKIYEAGFQTTEDIIRATEDDFFEVIGSNGEKIYNGLSEVLSEIPLWKLMGSTNFFGRGVGKRKMKKLIDALGYEVVFTGSTEDFAEVEGFDEKTAEKVAAGMSNFLDWLAPLEEDGYITIQYEDETTGDKLAGEKIVFTGFRDKQLQALAEANGATFQSSVSGKTTILVAANPASNSGKMKKARDAGVRIMSIDEFKEMV